jgi:hypothetical protein
VFADDDPRIGAVAVADLIQRWQVVKGVPPAPAAERPVDEIAKMAESIRGQWKPGMSKSEVSRMFGKPYAGPSWCAKVNQVIDYLSSSTSSSASSTEKMPDSGLMPA